MQQTERQESESILNEVQDSTGRENPAFISVDEMAKLLSIARVTAYQLTKISGFPCFYIGKRIIIPLSSFHKWATEQADRQSVIFEK